jgi:hypothetical protein
VDDQRNQKFLGWFSPGRAAAGPLEEHPPLRLPDWLSKVFVADVPGGRADDHSQPTLPDWLPRPWQAFVPDTAFAVDTTRESDEWSLRVERDGVRVWKRRVRGSPHVEVRANGVIRAPPRKVLALLKDSDAATIRKYNPTYAGGYDLEIIDDNTRVSYGEARRIFPFQPRDTVTRIEVRKIAPAELDGTGGVALLLRATTHPAMPPRPGYVRAKIVRGATVMQPVHGAPGVTNFTITQQVDAGGVIPPSVLNSLMTQDSVNLVKRVGAAARDM